MYYIDDYKSRAVTNTPPVNKELRKKLEVETKSAIQMQLNAFWKIMGLTIADKFDEIQSLLDRYGYKVSNEEDAAVAVADLWEKTKWMDFLKEVSILMEATMDENLVESIIPEKDESGFVEALIGAIGAIGGGTLNTIKSKKDAEAAKENAKAVMISSLSQVKVEREKARLEREKMKASKSKSVTWIVIVSLLVVVIIVAVVIYKRRKAQASI
jgi:cobalamin biosynthesis Mg chelatase CobN